MKQYKIKTVQTRYKGRKTWVGNKDKTRYPRYNTPRCNNILWKKQVSCGNTFKILIKHFNYDELLDSQKILSSMLCDNKIDINSSDYSENVKALINWLSLYKSNHSLHFLEQCLSFINFNILEKNNKYVNEKIGADNAKIIYEKFKNEYK